MANIYDYINKVNTDDGLVTNVNYNFQENPSTQAYHQIAAQNNPDYAQAIGDVYRWGDINRANNNLNLDVLSKLNNKKYLEKIQNEQRLYAEQLADKKFEQQKELLRLKSMFDLRNIAKNLNSKNTVVNNTNNTTENPIVADYKYKLATEMDSKDIPTINEYYNTEGFNGIKSTDLNLDEIKKEAEYLNKIRSVLTDPTYYPGNTEAETRYKLDKLFNNYIDRVNNFNNQAELYQNTAAQSNADIGKNFISNQIDPQDLEFDNKNNTLKNYIIENNAQIPTSGWESTPELQQIGMYLMNNDIDLSNRYPIQNGDDIVLYNTANGTIESLNLDEDGNISLQTMKQIEQPTEYMTIGEKLNDLGNLIKDARYVIPNGLRHLFSKDPNEDLIWSDALMNNRAR